MSTHLSRKELKQDNVALKVEETTHFLVTHRDLVIKVGIGTLVVLGVAAASWFFITSRRDARELALSNALQTVSAPVGAAPTAGAGTTTSPLAPARRIMTCIEPTPSVMIPKPCWPTAASSQPTRRCPPGPVGSGRSTTISDPVGGTVPAACNDSFPEKCSTDCDRPPIVGESIEISTIIHAGGT